MKQTKIFIVVTTTMTLYLPSLLLSGEREGIMDSLHGCIGAESVQQVKECPVSGDEYLGQKPPGMIPEIFAPGIVSVEGKNTHALSISPDKQTIILSRYPDRTSYIISFQNGKWSSPVESFFYGKEVSFSEDGNRIYYYTDGDIYFVEKKDEKWSLPVKMGSEINTAETEYYPSIVKSGNLYFSRAGSWKTGKIMLAEFKDGKYVKAKDIGTPVNSGGALHAWIAPDESMMLFNSPREGSYTKLDIWISMRQSDGSWSAPGNLGEKINSGADAVLCPTISPDGKYLFFTKLDFTVHTGKIYWVSTEIFRGFIGK